MWVIGFAGGAHEKEREKVREKRQRGGGGGCAGEERKRGDGCQVRRCDLRCGVGGATRSWVLRSSTWGCMGAEVVGMHGRGRRRVCNRGRREGGTRSVVAGVGWIRAQRKERRGEGRVDGCGVGAGVK